MTGRNASVLAIASGKGGVGKTNVAVNLSVALARLGHRVGLMDADFGLGNVDMFLGLTPQRHVGHLLAGEASLEQLVVTGPAGVQIVPASSGLRELTSLTAAQRETLATALGQLRASLDFLFIDTASGISDTVVETMLLADRVIVVASVEPAAIVDAYATVKVLTSASPATEVGIIVNSVRSEAEASLAFRQLDVAANRFLGRALTFYGFVADDPAVRDAVLTQRAIVEQMPQAAASRCFRTLAARLAGLRPTSGPGPKAVLVRTMPSSPAAEVPRCA